MTQVALASAMPLAARRIDLRKIGSVVALVVVLHALLLAVPRQPAVVSGQSPSTPASVQVRVLEMPSKPALPPAAVVALGGAPAGVDVPFVATPAPKQSGVEAARASAPDVAPVPTPANTWLGLALPGAAGDDDLYFPRSQLLVAPAAIDPVVIDYPRFDGDAGRYVAELSLFIDETGRVARIRVDSGSLPPALEDAARRAFTQARFRPGEAAEHGTVKSRIRIEVVFESGQRPPSGG